MNKMKSMYLAMMGMALAFEPSTQRNYYPVKSAESEEEKKIRLKEQERNIAIKRGLKPFVYGDTTIYALNQRTADKKAKRLNLL